MMRWTCWLCLALVASLAATGCSKNKAATVTVSVVPSAATVLLNTSFRFAASVSGSSNGVSWDVNGVAGGNATLGTVDATGLYTAPAVSPGTASVTIHATVQNTSATAAATVTLDSGVRVFMSQPTCAVGTGETFMLSAGVTGTTNQAVTWSVSSGTGSIDQNGNFLAPAAAAETDTIKATSMQDSSQSATATITVVSAQDPAITSISPTTGAIGALQQDIFVTGSNFICTTNFFVTNSSSGSTFQVSPASALSGAASTTLVRIPDSLLATLPTSPNTTVKFTFAAARKGGTRQQCSACQLTLFPVRPAIVGASPDSISQPGSGSATFSFSVDGGFFGPPSSPVVGVQFAGQTKLPSISAVNPDRQLSVTINGTDVSAGPGLYPVELLSNITGATVPPAVVNLAVQPSYSVSVIGTPVTVGVGSQPSAVAINTATGIAVVANQGSHDVTLVNLSGAVVTPSLCTGAIGTQAAPCPVATSPVSVAVDNVLNPNLALVANSANSTLAVVDLTAKAVTTILSLPTANGSALIPLAVGINPVTHRAIVAYRQTNVASILDLTQLSQPCTPQSCPAMIGVVQASTWLHPHISVSPKLNWALVTPGGAGSLSIVDLGRQTTNQISSLSRNAGIVSVNTSSTLALRAGQPVLISGVADASFNGIFSVLSVSNTTFTYSQSGSGSSTGGTASYALPIATVGTNRNVGGVAFNDETQKAILVDPTGGVPAFIFNALDQGSNAVTGLPTTTGYIAAAFNPLANIAAVVNQANANALVVDPTTPAVLPNSTFSVGNTPVDVAIDPVTNTAVIVNQGSNNVSIVSLGTLRSAPQILQSSASPGLTAAGAVIITSTLGSPAVAQPQTLTIIGGGFTSTSVARLDGASLTTTFVSNRELTASVPAAMLQNGGPRRYALDVIDSGVISNASSLTVIQSVNIAGSGCSVSTPQGVAIDSTHNIAVVTDPGCNDVALINLPAGTGSALAVGTKPQGVAVLSRAGLAVVANAGSNNASIVDIVNGGVPATVTTDPIPTGVAIDQSTGKAVVTALGANVVDTFAVSATPGTPTTITVQQAPSGVSIDPIRHLAAVANTGSNTVSVVNLSANSTTLTTSTSPSPSGVAFDPVSADFLITSSASNQVQILDPNTGIQTPIRVGINPTSLAYNFETSTLVTANSSSQTLTVIDFLGCNPAPTNGCATLRAALPITPSGQFAVDIHPLLNLAVVADPVHNQVLLLPLPR